jgi:hypothetical protein
MHNTLPTCFTGSSGFKADLSKGDGETFDYQLLSAGPKTVHMWAHFRRTGAAYTRDGADSCCYGEAQDRHPTIVSTGNIHPRLAYRC